MIFIKYIWQNTTCSSLNQKSIYNCVVENMILKSIIFKQVVEYLRYLDNLRTLVEKNLLCMIQVSSNFLFNRLLNKTRIIL